MTMFKIVARTDLYTPAKNESQPALFLFRGSACLMRALCLKQWNGPIYVSVTEWGCKECHLNFNYIHISLKIMFIYISIITGIAQKRYVLHLNNFIMHIRSHNA